jgi:hypothetical protein
LRLARCLFVRTICFANRTKKNLENLANAFGFEMEEEVLRASERINLRLTLAEKNQLRQQFQSYKKRRGSCSMTRFILDRCLSYGKPTSGHTLIQNEQSSFNSMLNELSRQGKNINQIAKKMNSVQNNKVIYNEAQNLKSYLKQNDEVLQLLRTFMSKA